MKTLEHTTSTSECNLTNKLIWGLRESTQFLFMKKIIIIIIILILLFGITIYFKNKKTNIEVLRFKNIPCYYYVSNDSVRLFGVNSSEVNLYKDSKSDDFFFKTSNNTYVYECESINFTESDICGQLNCLTTTFIENNGICQDKECSSYKINDFLFKYG